MKKHIKFKLIEPQTEIILSGQMARTLMHLIKSGKKGITALEMSSWAVRLGAYVHLLRREMLLNIETKREPHQSTWSKGSHARYVLHSEIEIIGPVEQ